MSATLTTSGSVKAGSADIGVQTVRPAGVGVRPPGKAECAARPESLAADREVEPRLARHSQGECLCSPASTHWDLPTSYRKRLLSIARTIDIEAQTWVEGFALSSGSAPVWRKEEEWAQLRWLRLTNSARFLRELARTRRRRA
jgi:hypothetical protein